MALYLGDTEVAPVIEVPVPETLYGATISNLLGKVDENGAYQLPTEPFTLDLSSVKSLPAYGLYYKFYKAPVSGDLVIGLDGNLSGSYAMGYAFSSCSKLTSISFPQLATISGYYAMDSAFIDCSNLTSVSFPALTTISDSSAMGHAFYSCSNLTSVSFPQLTTISGGSAMQNAFAYCSKLTSVSFPALTTVATNAFGTASYAYMFAYCTALTEIHFRADAQAAIEAVTGYADKWGAKNATIYFDL